MGLLCLLLLETFDDSVLEGYLGFISELFPHLSVSDDVAFDDETDAMDIDIGSQSAVDVSQIATECLAIINSPSHVAKLMNFCHNSDSKHSLLQIAQLCHSLTSKLKQRVHSNR